MENKERPEDLRGFATEDKIMVIRCDGGFNISTQHLTHLEIVAIGEAIKANALKHVLNGITNKSGTILEPATPQKEG